MASRAAPNSLLGDVVQPESLSLFSSTSSNPFALWALHQDPDLEEDSGIRLLIDSTDVTALHDAGIPVDSFKLRSDEPIRGSCSEPVLHIQSPSIRGTFIRSPPNKDTQLGIKLPYLTFQFRPIGSFRPFLFEVGIIDERHQQARIRVSSFQVEPKLYFKPAQDDRTLNANGQNGVKKWEQILHLPLTMAAQPTQEQTSLTSWQVLTLPLDQFVKYCSDTCLLGHDRNEQEKKSKMQRLGRFEAVSHVKVHANVRLRRVWCSKQLPDHDLAEFQVFS
ncbi:uncharacterized protein UDID_02996 [Ustilago sp. UG-2017a]|nr:uncharacterized protein UDID_02996 [Ustilago sp. UG-2017a]SPC67337.1 uncharacterized protein UHOD_02996 [Ustilago sp. UG-2017b]